MKKEKIKAIAFAASLFAGLAASALGTNGDIYEIRPCTQEGTARAAWATKAEPLDSGVSAYFNVRLIQGEMNNTNKTWFLDYDGFSSETLMEAMFPLQIGVYVSGKLTYATLVTWKADKTTGFTDLVFEYKTQVGDYALPVVLATADGPATSSDGSNTYLLNRYGASQWRLVDLDGDECNFWFWTPQWPVSAPDGDRKQDFTLIDAGIYVKTVDFDTKWESGDAQTYSDEGTGLWRSVHEGSIETVGATPSIQATAATTNSTTLYVWSTDESAVRINGGTKRTLTIGYADGEPVTTSAYVGTVTIAGGQSKQDFYIKGVSRTGGESGDGTATLVLSAWPDYSYNNVNGRIDDYITVPVKCVEPLPTSVVVTTESEEETVFVPIGDGWKTKVETLLVYVTQPVDEDLAVTVTPSVFGEDLDMTEYVKFSTSSSSVKTPGQLSDTATVTIPAGQSGVENAKKVFVYLFKGDSNTTENTIDFTPSISDAQAASTGIENFSPASFYAQATAPTIDSPADDAEIGATAGVDIELEIEVSDTYADEHFEASDGDGYTIRVKYYDAAGWVTLDGTYYVTAGGVLRTAGGKLPVLSYPISSASSSTGTFTTQIEITEPINGNKAVKRLVATVGAPKTVTITAPNGTVYNEGDTMDFTIELSDPNDTGDTIYAFLRASGNAEAAWFDADYVICADTDFTTTAGLPINKNNYLIDDGTVDLLEGDGAKNGLKIQFEVVLCRTQQYNEANLISGYDSNYLNIRVKNVEPTIKRVELNNTPSKYDGFVFSNKIPKGQTVRFRAYVDDPGEYDLANGFMCRWTASRNGVTVGTPVEQEGNPSSTPFDYTFPTAGDWTITLEVKDKDMNDWSETTYSVGVTVLDNPYVEVTPSQESYDENAKGGKITFQLSYWDDAYTGSLRVKVTVAEYSPGRTNPGRLILDNNYATDEEGVYYITVNGPEEYDLMIEEMDGTDVASIYGFNVTAEVVSEDVLPTSGTPANEYYLAQSARILVNNVTPTVSVQPAPNTNAWEVAGGLATSRPIRWKIINDVGSDFVDHWASGDHQGIRVTITGCDNEFTGYYTEPTGETFVPDFGEMQGDATVTVTIEDKDGGFETFEYLYSISASKFLVTKATGPNGGTTTSALSNKYRSLVNRGMGHTYAAEENGIKFSSAANYVMRWNCGMSSSARIYGFGYKIASPDDNGSLDGGNDIALNENGYATSGVEIENCYHYPLADLDEDSADRKDSYFYCWLRHSTDENGTMTSEYLGATISPEVPSAGIADGSVSLAGEPNEDGSYPLTEVEAIFSKEWRTTDNLGDINADGVPDVFAIRNWQNGNLIELATGGEILDNDLVGLARSNPDEDRLPGAFINLEKAISVNGYAYSYAPIGPELTTRMEIRGFHDGLNATDSTSSDPDFSEAEQAAWKAYAEANGLDPESPDLSVWSPEPTGTSSRMDPTVEDTDGDGFPDGWEYFFWYQAHVWVPAGDERGQPISTEHQKQKYVFERFRPSNILEGEEITPEEVEERFNPCQPFDAAAYAEKPDFDNDGLSDLEELVIGTNPCHWDTDGDHICDGYEAMMGLDPLSPGKTTNEDGDFMAYHRVSEDMIFASDDETGRVYLLSGLEAFVDYSPFSDVLIKSGEFEYYSFVPKMDGEGEPLRYGTLEDGAEPNQPDDWIYGMAMVDGIERGVTNLQSGTQLSLGGDYVLVHNQVMDAFGFDPRTGWANFSGYVSDRWNPAKNKSLNPSDQTGLAVNTRGYYSYDEYLVMKYRYDYSIRFDDSKAEEGFDENNIWATMRNKTTVPTVLVAPSEGENAEDGDDTSMSNTTYVVSQAIAAALKQANSAKNVATGHGADTDADGVPDGWELYTFRNPNLAPITTVEDGLGNALALDFDGDTLSYAQEYAGTDSCEAYPECETIFANHPGTNSGWYNKFFPTNPGTMMDRGASYAAYGNPDGVDTDLDGVPDNIEGGNWNGVFYQGGTVAGSGSLGFVYGNVTNDAYETCFQGGGMNPCTIDTDQDGLPDGWEAQFAGVPVDAATGEVVPVRNKTKKVVKSLDYGTKIGDMASDDDSGDDDSGDGDGEEDEESGTLGYYIAGGMDATYSGDVTSVANVRDMDFDHDGLENWQEYMVQALRHLRYDDITTPLMGRQLEEGDNGFPHQQNFWGFVKFDPADFETFAADCAEAWYGKDAVYYVTVTTGVKVSYELVNPQTGEMKTNLVYTVAQRKKYYSSAEEVVKHVENGGENQYAWNEEGWRKLGYFAKPRQKWDRSIVGGSFLQPLYMLPVTGEMDFDRASPVGYVSTDPRTADSDGDGMDDGWELFHGLNPILGSLVDNPSEAIVADGRKGDIIAATYSVPEFFNGFRNEWVRPGYNRELALHGQEPDAYGPIAAPQAFDPVLYPWIMGSPGADADGDGMRNEDEAILANVADPVGRHTDPSPLWFTERTTPASYTYQYYAMPMYVKMIGKFTMLIEDSNDTYLTAAEKVDDDSIYDYVFSFEESEGYDTDSDMTPDALEVASATMSATDALDFTDPSRSQALYLDGVNSYAVTKDVLARVINSSDFLKQFTVECWLMPERTGVDQTVVERSSYYEGDSITADEKAIRANFRIGIAADGRLYGMFDNSDCIDSGLNSPISCQIVYGNVVETGEWVHAALSFDGETLSLYMDGELVTSAKTSLVPANGVRNVVQNPGSTNTFPVLNYNTRRSAFFVGARPQMKNEYALLPVYVDLLGMHHESFDNLREYFKGYVDEVRVWDGARDAVSIKNDYRKAYTAADVYANRDEVFNVWLGDGTGETRGTRNNNDGRPNLPPELVLHYNFSTIPGAAEPEYVAKLPAGYSAKTLGAAMSDYATNGDISDEGLYPNLLELKGGSYGEVAGDLNIGWWSECEVRSTVYNDYHRIPWIQNTVAHLTPMDGSCLDTRLYSDSYGAVYTPASKHGLDKYVFPNAMNPYSSYYRGNDLQIRYRGTRRIWNVLGDEYQARLAQYDIQTHFNGVSDLVPLGGAFAKTCKKMWYGGVSDVWEFTGEDDDGDGLPEWWEEYARNNYSPDLDPSEGLIWTTIVERNGVKMTAGTAYILDIHEGMQPDGSVDSSYASNYDANGNFIPDWWEKLYKIEGTSGFQDTDGDGLSDYIEYLLSEVFDLGVKFDPANARSINGVDLDYFAKIGELYAGEIFTDHDMIEDFLEDKWGEAWSSRYLWDRHADKDEDGWGNFAEARFYGFCSRLIASKALHYLGDDEMKDMPIPVLKLNIRYNGSQKITGAEAGENGSENTTSDSSEDNNQVENRLAPIIVQTYTREGTVVPDAKFTVVPGETLGRRYYLGGWSDRIVRGYLAPGYVQVGDLSLMALPVSSRALYWWKVFDTVVKGDFASYLRDLFNYGSDNVELLESTSVWGVVDNFAVVAQTDTTECRLVFGPGQIDVGTVDSYTGEFKIDLGKLSDVTVDGDTTSTLDLPSCVFRFNYKSQIPTLRTGRLQLYLGEANTGYVREGKNTIVAFYDLDADGNYTPGEPFGCVCGEEIGWYGRDIDIMLTDTSAVITRASLLTGESSNASDRRTLYGLEDGDATNFVAGTLTSEKYQYVQIVRAEIDGHPLPFNGIPRRTIFTKMMQLDQRPFFYEGDILESGDLDIDWTYFNDEVVSRYSDPTAVTYHIILGAGGNSGTFTNIYEIATTRHFDGNSARPYPRAISPGETDSVVIADHPTFTWSMDGYNSYTAFRVQILDQSSNVVWDSGMRRAIEPDYNGVYHFEADAYVGDELEKGVQYKWRVSMYNSKFRSNRWSSETPSFYMQTIASGKNYQAIPVRIKYFGPSTVADNADFVAEAFTTPDFTGIPVARVAVSDNSTVVSAGAKREANAVLTGLPVGTYYVRAYADFGVKYGTHRKLDSWESWGYACPRQMSATDPFMPVAIETTDLNGSADPLDVYIEDVDTNQNAVPDAWEIVANGGTLDNGAARTLSEVAGSNTAVYNAIAANITGKVVSSAGASPSATPYIELSFTSPTLTALALGVDPDRLTFNNDGTVTVENEVEDVKIVSLGFGEDGSLALSVEGVLDGSAAAGGLGVVTVNTQTEKTVTCEVYRKEALDQAGWELVATKEITVGREAQKVEIEDVAKSASGFFKVKVY